MAERVCTAKTKAGKSCKATPRGDTGLCNAHSPKEVRESAGFGGAQPGAGRPRNPRVVDVLRERIEAEVDKWLKPLEDALTADRGVVVGDGPSAHVEFVEDHATRLKAQAQAFDRAFGRPTQPIENDDPSRIDREIEQLLSEFDRRDASRANGNGQHASV